MASGVSSVDNEIDVLKLCIFEVFKHRLDLGIYNISVSRLDHTHKHKVKQHSVLYQWNRRITRGA